MTLPAGPLTWEALVTLPCELLPVSSRLFTSQNEEVELSLSLGDHRRPHSLLGIRTGDQWRIMPPAAAFLPFDRPFHVAMVVDTMSIRCYVEGRTTGTIASPEFAGMPLTFNLATWPTRSGKFTGVLDELRISSGARYDDDFAPVARFESDDRTRLLYHFDESEGDVVLDASGHAHHGKLVGRTKRVISAPYAPLSAPRLPEDAR